MGPGEQLAKIRLELADAQRRAHRLGAASTGDLWTARPAPDQWSAAECLAHLNLTSRAFLPVVEEAIARGHDRQLFGSAHHRMDFVGRLLWLAVTVRVPFKTTQPFVPLSTGRSDAVLAEFDGLQSRLIGCLEGVAGLDLGKLRIVSPFDSRLRYNLYSAFRLIPAHQRQHLAQAERIIDRNARPSR